MRARDSIHRTYFGYDGLGAHATGCPRTGKRAGTWEVSIAHDDRYAIDPRTGDEVMHERADIRLLCRSCGSVVRLRLRGPDTIEYTNVSEIGYGAKPERCAGMWLHPGAPILLRDPDGTGPWDYYVTDSPNPPADESEVVGIISRHLTPRRALRWLAGHGQRPGGGVHEGAPDHFQSKPAAVKWIIGRRDAAAAAAAGEEVTG